MSVVEQQIIELAIGETAERRYVVDEELDDGRVILRPRTELEEMRERLGTRPMTQAEFDELIAPHLLPSDGEG